MAAGAVALDGEPATVTAEDGHVHRVRTAAGVLSFGCPWWAKYRGGRGPCKHAVAVRMARRGAAAGRYTAGRDTAGPDLPGRRTAGQYMAEIGGGAG